jgi:hypothetical protein
MMDVNRERISYVITRAMTHRLSLHAIDPTLVLHVAFGAQNHLLHVLAATLHGRKAKGHITKGSRAKRGRVNREIATKGEH